MSGYSGTPLATKLGIKDGHALALVEPPGGLSELLEPMPAGATVVGKPGEADVTVAFVDDRASLARRLDELGAAIFPDRTLWIAWPKRTSRVATDVTENVVRELALPLGLVDNKVCSIDSTWSGLRLVWRKELRSEPRPHGRPAPRS